MKLELPERKKLVHTLQIPIRWGDMDAMNHEIIVRSVVRRSPFSLGNGVV